MAADVDAVIAALRVALEESQKSDDVSWKVEAANRWVEQLPGAWSGRWRKLVLRGASRLPVELRQAVRRERASLVEALLARERWARATTDRERR